MATASVKCKYKIGYRITPNIMKKIIAIAITTHNITRNQRWWISTKIKTSFEMYAILWHCFLLLLLFPLLLSIMFSLFVCNLLAIIYVVVIQLECHGGCKNKFSFWIQRTIFRNRFHLFLWYKMNNKSIDRSGNWEKRNCI